MFSRFWRSAQRWVAERAALPAVRADNGGRLPTHLPWTAWLLGITAVLLVYGWLFTYVHVRADTQPCRMRLDDPLYLIVPLNLWWKLINVHLYTVLTITCVGLMLIQAALGDHRPVLRFGTALAVMGLIRGLCILMIPLCRVNSEVGSVVFTQTPTLDLGLVTIPWRMWAKNDMLFSGHVGEFFILMRITKSWPWPARGVLISFFTLQLFGLLSTRSHYTIDMILAIPCAYFADRMSVHALALASRWRAAVPAAQEEPARVGSYSER